MARELMIDRAIYLIDDEKKSYRFLRRNPAWEELTPHQNEMNKKQIDGYTRIFRNRQTKVFHFRKR